MASTSSNIYKFKITLLGSKLPVWRRIHVPENYSFWDLHVAITDAMGWKDYHKHQFRMIHPKTKQDITIGTREDDGGILTMFGYNDRKMISETTAKIAKYFLTPKDKAQYEYDFGDGWEHEVIFEKVLEATAKTKYPQCVAGELACPPEDCGGVRGFEKLLKILADPQHKEYKENREWLETCGYGENFNPRRFDYASVIFWNPKVRRQNHFTHMF